MSELFVIDVTRKIPACQYARTLGGEERNLEQLLALKSFAEEHNMKIVETILDHTGGDVIDRPKIEELYTGLEKGKYEVILILNTGKIANNPNDARAFCKNIKALGGMVYSLEEGFCHC